MSPVGLEKLLKRLPRKTDPNLLVGFEHSDDAGVYRISDDMALVTTADFITPPVNDPIIYGRIAAANAISDIYAMGGRPLTCLNLVCFPPSKLKPEILEGIITGALSKITEAGAVLAGGHTVEDDEPKFGLAVTGIVHPDAVWKNSGARPGDVLILTKPVGSGVLFNANIKHLVSREGMDFCIQTISTLNKTAAEIFSNFEVHAATDVTGFGLGGHGLEMAKGSDAEIRICLDEIPVMPEAVEMYRRGITTGVNSYNRQLVEPFSRISEKISSETLEIVFDPQTSGGLLVAVPESQGKSALNALSEAGIDDPRIIGYVTEKQHPDVYIVFS